MTQDASPRGAYLAMGLTIFFWATAPLVLKYFTGVMDAWTVNGLRYIFTALFWLPVVFARWREIPPGRNIFRDAWVPACCHMLGQAGWGLAPYYNDASVMNFVSRAAFLLTIVAGFWLLQGERHLARRPLFWVGVAATVAGLLAMFGGGLHANNTSAAGMGLLLWTSACWSLYSVQVRKRMGGYPAALAFGVVSLLAVPGLTAAMFALGDWRAMFTLSTGQWSALALSAWLGIALGHVLFYHCIRALGPVLAEGALSLIPFVTFLAAHLAFGEELTRAQWTGGVLLVSAVFCLLGARVRPRTTQAGVEHAGG